MPTVCHPVTFGLPPQSVVQSDRFNCHPPARHIFCVPPSLPGLGRAAPCCFCPRLLCGTCTAGCSRRTWAAEHHTRRGSGWFHLALRAWGWARPSTHVFQSLPRSPRGFNHVPGWRRQCRISIRGLWRGETRAGRRPVARPVHHVPVWERERGGGRATRNYIERGQSWSRSLCPTLQKKRGYVMGYRTRSARRR